MEAIIILGKCPKTHQIYGMRTQKMDSGDWLRTCAFPLDARRARAEGYDRTTARGSLGCTEGYTGCPYCGTRGFVVCRNCGKFTCWSGETRMKCEWCGCELDNIVDCDDFEVSGGDI